MGPLVGRDFPPGNATSGETLVNQLTRRDFGKLALAGLALPVLAEAQTVSGVRLGVQTYSFRDLPRTPGGDATDAIIAAMTACGFTECELWAPQIEPAAAPAARGARPSAEDQQNAREELRKWRTETPLSYFQDIARKFRAAGQSIYAYNFSFNSANMSDGEIDRAFDITKALGAEIITASTTLTMARRVAPFAEKHTMVVAMHNHSQVAAPDEFAKPESFAEAMQISKFFKVNLDIGHFTAANYDAVAYLREHHADITNLHLKDRKKNQGENTPWGEGETPIREVLQLLKKERWPIRAYVEYEYRGTAGPVDEVKKCAAYARQALA
jgi:sugar phosphate isomerase/epimerase